MIEIISSIGLILIMIIGRQVIREPGHYKELLNIAIAVSITSIVIIKFFFFQAKNYCTNVKRRLTWLSALTVFYMLTCVIEFVYFNETLASRSTAFTPILFIAYHVLCIVGFAIYKMNYLHKSSVYGKSFLGWNIAEIVVFIVILILNSSFNKRTITESIVIAIICLFFALALIEFYIARKKDYWLDRKTLHTNIYIMAKFHTAGDYNTIVRYFSSKNFLALCNQVLTTSFIRKNEIIKLIKFVRKQFIKCNFTEDESNEIACRFGEITATQLMNRKYDLWILPNFVVKLFTSKQNDRRGKKDEQK